MAKRVPGRRFIVDTNASYSHQLLLYTLTHEAHGILLCAWRVYNYGTFLCSDCNNYTVSRIARRAKVSPAQTPPHRTWLNTHMHTYTLVHVRGRWWPGELWAGRVPRRKVDIIGGARFCGGRLHRCNAKLCPVAGRLPGCRSGFPVPRQNMASCRPRALQSGQRYSTLYIPYSIYMQTHPETHQILADVCHVRIIYTACRLATLVGWGIYT